MVLWRRQSKWGQTRCFTASTDVDARWLGWFIRSSRAAPPCSASTASPLGTSNRCFPEFAATQQPAKWKRFRVCIQSEALLSCILQSVAQGSIADIALDGMLESGVWTWKLQAGSFAVSSGYSLVESLGDDRLRSHLWLTGPTRPELIFPARTGDSSHS